MPEIKMDFGPLVPLASDWKPRKPRKRASKVRCRDCGMRCFWQRTASGRWALGHRDGTWHYWKCKKQEPVRAMQKAQRALECAALDRIARDRT